MTEPQLQRLAQRLAEEAYTYIISATSIDRVTAQRAAKAAGDEAAAAIAREIGGTQ